MLAQLWMKLLYSIEAVQQITFDEHDDLIKGILDETIGTLDIKKALGIKEDEDEFNYRSQKYLSLRNAIRKADSWSLLSWVGRHAPKFDIIILSDALI